MQDYIDNFVAKLETSEDRKQPDMGNAGKSINGHLRGLEAGAESLGIRNAITYYLKSIKFNNVQTKLSTRAKTSLIERGGKQGCKHN